MEQEQVMFATAGAVDLTPPLFEIETANDSHLDSATRQHIGGDDHRRQLKRAVAALPQSAIGDMQRRELIFAIRTAELPWLDDAGDHLEHADRLTLERLAFLARRVCRRQLLETAPLHASRGIVDPIHRHDGRHLCDEPEGVEASVNRGWTAVDSLHWRERAR
jgi:hypothetical protein